MFKLLSCKDYKVQIRLLKWKDGKPHEGRPLLGPAIFGLISSRQKMMKKLDFGLLLLTKEIHTKMFYSFCDGFPKQGFRMYLVVSHGQLDHMIDKLNYLGSPEPPFTP